MATSSSVMWSLQPVVLERSHIYNKYFKMGNCIFTVSRCTTLHIFVYFLVSLAVFLVYLFSKLWNFLKHLCFVKEQIQKKSPFLFHSLFGCCCSKLMKIIDFSFNLYQTVQQHPQNKLNSGFCFIWFCCDFFS